MESQQVDIKLLAMLKDLPYFSRLGVCISIRLADYAAQLCGCRSSRQIDGNLSDDVSEQFDSLINSLKSNTAECILYIENKHNYKQDVLEMSDENLELLLEDTLYEMIQFNCRHIFVENFFDSK
jgi:hypothetical protein